MTNPNLSRRNILKATGALGVAGLAGCLGDDDATTVSVGVVSDSAAADLFAALRRVLDNEADDVQIVTEETPGVPASMQMYQDGDVDALGVTNYAAIQAMEDEGPFADEPVDTFAHQGFGLAIYHFHWVKAADSDIETTDDLAGSNVYALPPGWSFREMIEEVHRTEGTWDDIEPGVSNADTGDVADAFEEGRIEAALSYPTNLAGVPGFYSEVDARTDLEFIEPSDSWIQAVEDNERVVLDEQDLSDQYEQDMGDLNPVPSVQTSLQLAFGEEVPDEAAYEITRISHEYVDDIREGSSSYPDHSDLNFMTDGHLPEAYQLPIHGGVADFLEEQDHWDDSWERA